MTINYAKHDEEFHGVFKLVSGEEILAKAVLTTEDYGTDTKESLAFLQDPVCIQIIDKATVSYTHLTLPTSDLV